MKILFICRGNVARSQIAEAIFNNLSEKKHIAVSAGTKVVKEDISKEGQKIKDIDTATNIIITMREVGIDVSDHIRNQLTFEIFEKADKVIVMAEMETVPEYLKQSGKVIFWEVSDPKGQSLEFTRQIRNQINILIENLIKTI